MKAKTFCKRQIWSRPNCCKAFLLFILCIILGNYLKAQQKSYSALHIIGLFHNANKQRTTDSLLNKLQSIGPDIILSEMDTTSNMFRGDFTLRNPPWWYQLAVKLHLSKKMIPEHAVLYSYRQINKDIHIFPFDISIPKRRKYVRKNKKFEASLVKALNRANEKGEIPEQFHETFKTYVSLNNYLFNLSTYGYSFINRPEVTDSLRILMQVEYSFMPELIETIPRLMSFWERYEKEMKYWQHRNEVMVKNIRYFADKHPGKKMVVLTGLLHKYILLDLLIEDAQLGGKMNVKE